MKITSTFALAAALLLMLAAPLRAGTVRVGILKGDDFEKWYCDPSKPPPKPPAVFRCEGAKFQECGHCNTVAVQNNSGAPAEVEFKFTGAGFSKDVFPGAGMAFGPRCDSSNGFEGRPLSFGFNCNRLSPGEACKQEIEFCPERSGISRGRMIVIATANSRSQTITLDLIAEAIYSPELQAADEARRRHLDELMKIPHVAKVDLDSRDDEIFINVEVEQGASLDKVQRAAPPKIEGYDVEVSRYIEQGWAD